MLIILDGPNKSGKSTLAKAFKKGGFIYFKDDASLIDNESPLRDEMMASAIYAQAKLLSVLANETNIIVDRFHITELVYRTLERKTNLAVSQEKVEEILSNCNNVLQVFVYDEPENLESRGCSRAGEKMVLYSDLFAKSKLSTLFVKTDSIKDVRRLEKYAKLSLIDNIEFEEGKVVV